MMRRIWLAVVLGIFLGLGLAVGPTSTVSQDKEYLPVNTAGLQLGESRQTVQQKTESWMDIQFLVLDLAAGLVVAVPLFMVAKKRG